MAYTDQRTATNQRAAVMAVVAALQGAAIIALVHGLAVHFIKPEPIPNLQAPQIRLPPPPPQPLPTPQTHPTIQQGPVRDNPPHPTPLAQPQGEVIQLPPVPMPDPTPTQAIDLAPPLPTPRYTPHSARPRNAPGSWATASDYPTSDLRNGNQGVTRFTLAIGVDGRVQSCVVTATSGFPGLDRATCENVSRRARFEPATDGSGNRIASSYSGAIRWQMPKD